MEVIRYEGYEIMVQNETDPVNPRDWASFGTMVCFHGKYRLGDKHEYRESDYDSWDEVRNAIEADGGVCILPLSLYDHGGISIRVGSFAGKAQHASWDSGWVGFIYTTADAIAKEGVSMEEAEVILRNEVEAYDDYLRGDIYEYVIKESRKACSCGECSEWEVIENCGGYSDEDSAIKDAKSIVDAIVGKKVKA